MKEIEELTKKVEKEIEPEFKKIEEICKKNSIKVIEAFQKCNLQEMHLQTSTGYGIDEPGRNKIEEIYAQIFKAEDSLVRAQFISGTHALAITLSALLRPNDTMISITGAPYDTLQTVIGLGENPSKSSLKSYGVKYEQIELINNEFNEKEIQERLSKKDVKLIEIQRSRGYSTRKSLNIEKIKKIIAKIREVNKEAIIMVDNCYGEFVEEKEPIEVGADMIVGSLIKNPGGGLAPIGGYIAGKRECVENAAYRLTSPGLGKEVGASLGVIQSFYQGLFQAPVVTAGALKGAIFAANIYEKLGFNVVPNGKESRHDIIQAVTLNSPEALCAFCEGIQTAAPVDSYVTPEPWDMPGYDAQVIMAAGAFVQGSSIELSADGPLKPPYAVYFQGGLTWYHAKLGILWSLQKLYERNLVDKSRMC